MSRRVDLGDGLFAVIREEDVEGAEEAGFNVLPPAEKDENVIDRGRTYKADPADVADLENRFRHHPPREGEAERYEHLRGQAYLLAILYLGECPRSRELSLALTKLEEAMMWANAAIARNPQ